MAQYRDQEFIEKVGKKIVSIRNRKRITQEELMDRTGLTLSQVGRIERAEVNTSISMIALIAKGLQVKPKELFDV
ncbi:helix-turn-helix domain-containing protein [Algoriphagus sp. A40]|uniref:helix-turn-helix domain-containing protein n=1 Tax=Algoriphagus sp. A40 TaxID=1945863 RepID=UPI000986288A|nr:helix-turn-helix transcriptional regulator [Algoriphagus sp. A40]OOG76449.1 transcriptional regulator [Algoriphagus sp. A40]